MEKNKFSLYFVFSNRYTIYRRIIIEKYKIMTNELLNGCGHTQTTITKIMDRIEKKKDLMEFELLKNFLYNSIRKNATDRVKVSEKSK